MSEDPGGEGALQLAPLRPPEPAPRPQNLEPGSPYPKAELLQRLLARLFDLMVCGALVALVPGPSRVRRQRCPDRTDPGSP